MSSSNDIFRHESFHDRETIIKYLSAIRDGLEKGHLELGNGNGNQIILEPSGLLKLDLKAKRKDSRMKLSFKISWKVEEESTEKEQPEPLKIESEG